MRKKELNAAVTYMEIEAPFVARKAKAGQFIIFRVDEKSERVPLTIAGYDREKGTVAIIFQKVGLSTEMLGSLNEGDYIQDFVGPLGKPTDVEGKKRVCVVGGGVVVRGCAAVLGIADVRMLQQIIFQVNHGSFPTDKQNALAVIQQPHLVRGHKIAPGLLVVDAVTAAASLALVIAGGGDGFFSQQFRNIFVGFFLGAAEIEKLVT